MEKETKKTIKGIKGDPANDAIYITGKNIEDNNLSFYFNDDPNNENPLN